MLEDLGWTIHRIWSTDWWHNADSEVEKLLTAISAAVETREMEMAASDEQHPDGEEAMLEAGVSSASTPQSAPYTLTDFSDFADRISADRFYSADYEPLLRELIGHVLDTESPIADTLLVNRIARAHGLQRSGRIITERVMEISKRYFHVRPDPVGGTFVWRDKDSPATWSTYRTAPSEEATRKLEEISFEEIGAAIRTHPAGNVPVEVARAFGIRRLPADGRSRIEAVMRVSSGYEAS